MDLYIQFWIADTASPHSHGTINVTFTDENQAANKHPRHKKLYCVSDKFSTYVHTYIFLSSSFALPRTAINVKREKKYLKKKKNEIKQRKQDKIIERLIE